MASTEQSMLFHVGLGFRVGFAGAQIPVTTPTKIFPKVLRYKWEAYCDLSGIPPAAANR